jgi:hypothetical protein
MTAPLVLITRSPTGLLSAYWDYERDAAVILAPRAPRWSYELTDPGLSAWLEIATAFPDAGGQDLRWLAHAIDSVDEWQQRLPWEPLVEPDDTDDEPAAHH